MSGEVEEEGREVSSGEGRGRTRAQKGIIFLVMGALQACFARSCCGLFPAA